MGQKEHKQAGASRHGGTREEQRGTHVRHGHRLTKSGGEERRRRRIRGEWRKSHRRPHIQGKQRSDRERRRVRRGDEESGKEDEGCNGRGNDKHEQRAEARVNKKQCPGTRRAC